MKKLAANQLEFTVIPQPALFPVKISYSGTSWYLFCFLWAIINKKLQPLQKKVGIDNTPGNRYFFS